MAGTNCKAACDSGTPYRPTVFELAELLRAWDHTSSGDLDMPPSRDWSLVGWTTTPDRNNRIDMSTWAGWRQRRIFGYVAAIHENASGNSPTPYRFDVISKLPYCADAHLPGLTTTTDADKLSWLWVRTTAYSSNALVPPNTAIRLGSFAQGVVAARYNGPNRATLEAWSPVDWEDWRTTAGDTLITHNEVGFVPMTPLSLSGILGGTFSFLFGEVHFGGVSAFPH